MAELALYRKYRPRTFAEVIGQDHVTVPLSQALRSGRLHHAYLFSGPRGCGKTSSARILARSLNCDQGPTPDPCGVCESCRALAPDGAGSIDVIEIDAASHGGVDDARDLRERAFFAPVASRYKIYVIDEAHMVSSAGFNALLKLVEEPPEYVKFVFATTEPEKVLGTIKSRTHHYPFRLVPPAALRPYLEQLCAAENTAVEPAVFPLVVRAGGGSVRDALSVLDQLIAGAGPEGVTYARAAALLGVTDAALIDEVCDALAAADGRSVFTAIDRVADAGHDPRRFAGDLLQRLRDLIVLQQVPDAVEKGLLDGAEDELARMADQAERFGQATLSRMADIVHTGLVDMRGTTAPRLVLELIAARMLLPAADETMAAVLARVERLERRLTLASGATPATAESESEPPRPAGSARAEAMAAAARASSQIDGGSAAQPVAAAQPTAAPASAAGPQPASPDASSPDASSAVATQTAAPEVAGPTGSGSAKGPGDLDVTDVRRFWDQILTYVRHRSPRAAAVVREAMVRAVEGDVIVLLFKHTFHAEAVVNTQDLLVEALNEELGGQWRIRCEIAGQEGRPVAPTSAPVRGGGRDPGGSTTASAVPRPAPGTPPSQPGAAAPSSQTRPAAPSDQPGVTAPSGQSRPAAPSDQPGAAAPSGQSRAAAPADQPGAAVPSGQSRPAAPADQPRATAPSGPPRAVAASGPAAQAAMPGAPGMTTHAAAPGSTARAASSSASTQAGTAPQGAAGAATRVTDEDDDGWPTPAKLGGSGADGGVAVAEAPVRQAAPATVAANGGAKSAGAAAAARAAANAAAAPQRTGPPRAGSPRTTSPRTTSQRPGTGRPGGGRTAPASVGSAWDGGAADEEPPFDPEFDGPAGRPAAELGFDPGDEPADDASAPGQLTEQAALDLLRIQLGAERIGGTD